MTTLRQVDNEQTCEYQPHIGMDGVPDVEELQGPEGGSECAQETDMDRETGSGAPNGPPAARPFQRRPSLRLERRFNHLSAPSARAPRQPKEPRPSTFGWQSHAGPRS
ncbi:MAG TPA: hypothetical protein VGL48_09985, partial [Acidimicrobiales bacterium]